MNRSNIVVISHKIVSVILIISVGLVCLNSCSEKQESIKKKSASIKTAINKISVQAPSDTIKSQKDNLLIPAKVVPVISIIPEPDPEPRPPIGECGYYPPDCPTYDTVKTPSDFVLQFAEIMPEFPGGSQSMLEFIQNNLNYPDLAKENNIEGKVYLKFVVRSTGEIDNIQIARGIHEVLDTAAIELVKKMPRWNPGVQNGKTVSVYFILPVVFRLD
jgi:TonB family protein